MPIIKDSSYRPAALLRNGHLQTVLPSFIRRIEPVGWQRERIDTPDGDFLDLDWSRKGSDRLAILSHGLEGNSHRPYMVGMANEMNRRGWDTLAWNYRSCSGEINRRLRMYHNGSIDDLDFVIRHATGTDAYRSIALIGFSLGGNLSLLYLGSRCRELDPRIAGAVAFSVPCDLAAGSRELARPVNRLYMRSFLRSLHGKIRRKMAVLPGAISDDGYSRIRNFKDFDDRYTAPIHGFRDAEDYWQRCSCGPYLSSITVPTLIVNALDDPFLAGDCYPVRQARESAFVHLEMPDHGGHAGFVRFGGNGSYWSEERAAEFLAKIA